MSVRHAGDGSQRLFVVDRYGKVWIRPAGAATGVLPTPRLDISSGAPHGFSVSGEGGFLGLAFDPHYVDNRHFYVHYTSADGNATVVRYSAHADNPNVADPASATVILRVDQDTAYPAMAICSSVSTASSTSRSAMVVAATATTAATARRH